MRTLTLQVTEASFDFDDLDFTAEDQQRVIDSVEVMSLRWKLMMTMMMKPSQMF